MVEAEVSSEQDGNGRTGAVVYTDTFKIDGFVDPLAEGALFLEPGGEVLVVYDCKVYDRLHNDKFIFGMSRMEVRAKALEIALPRDAITKEGVF